MYIYAVAPDVLSRWRWGGRFYPLDGIVCLLELDDEFFAAHVCCLGSGAFEAALRRSRNSSGGRLSGTPTPLQLAAWLNTENLREMNWVFFITLWYLAIMSSVVSVMVVSRV